MNKKHSIGTKILCSIILLVFVMATVLSAVIYITYKSTMEKHYDTLGNNIAKTTVSMLDEDVMLAYRKNVQNVTNADDFDAASEAVMSTEEFQSILTLLRKIKANNDVTYLYIFYPTLEGGYYMFDTDETEENCPYGYYMDWYEGSFAEIADQMAAGAVIPAVVTDEDFGWLISISYPYFHSNGSLIGYFGVDISMDHVMLDRQMFLLNCVMIMAIITVAFSVVYMVVLNKIMIRPIRRMTAATSAFVADCENETNGVSPIAALDVTTKDELQTLCESLKEMEADLKRHIENLKKVTAEKERIGAELNVATQIQKSMLPCVFPAFPDRTEFDVYATMNPAKEVGGDFYDFFMVDDRHLAVVMADVSGKGVPAALFMVIGKTLIKDHSLPDRSLGEVFSVVNNLLNEANSEGLFITAFEGVLDLVTGEFNYVNAGHEMPFICPQNGDFKPYKIRPGFVLAGMEDMKYRAGTLTLEVGDKVYLYTDGVTEATNAENQLYGMERLENALNIYKFATPEALLPLIKADIDAFVGEAPQFDDITMLCLEYKQKMNHTEEAK